MGKKKKSLGPDFSRFKEAAEYLVASLILDAPDGLTTLTVSSTRADSEDASAFEQMHLVTIKEGDSLRYWTNAAGNCFPQSQFVNKLATDLRLGSKNGVERYLSAAYTETDEGQEISNDFLRQHLVLPLTGAEGWLIKDEKAVPHANGFSSWDVLTIRAGRDLYAALKPAEELETNEVAVAPSAEVMNQGVQFITGVIEAAGEGLHVITVAGASNGVGRVFFSKDKSGLIQAETEVGNDPVSAHTIIGLELSGTVAATLRSSDGKKSAFGPVEEVRGWTVTRERIIPMTADQVVTTYSIDHATGKLNPTDHGIAYRDAWEIESAA